MKSFQTRRKEKACFMKIWESASIVCAIARGIRPEVFLSVYFCLVSLFIRWLFWLVSMWGQHWHLTLSWRRPLSYRNQSIDLLCKSMDWFLYDNSLHHEGVKYYVRTQGRGWSTDIWTYVSRGGRELCQCECLLCI